MDTDKAKGTPKENEGKITGDEAGEAGRGPEDWGKVKDKARDIKD